jgi:hypothetical protein
VWSLAREGSYFDFLAVNQHPAKADALDEARLARVLSVLQRVL